MQIFNDKKQRVGILKGFKDRKIVKTLDSGDRELSFKYPSDGEMVDRLKEEYYIRTKDDEYVIRKKKTGVQFNEYTAQLNVEELEGAVFPYGFESKEQTIRACLEFAFEGTGWKVGVCQITKKRTINKDEETNAWKILQDCLSTYRTECKINSLTKTIDIYEQIGSDRGRYFIEGLNLKKLTVTSDTYDFYTRLIPLGKDGIGIEWLGKPYLENYQYSSKIKTYVWSDERYTNTTSLIEDGIAKLDEMSKPYVAYTADVIDLARQSEKYSSVFDFDIGDTVWMISKKTRTKEKQRIVKLTEYPEAPRSNTVELSNATKTFAEVQQEATDQAKSEAIKIANSSAKKVLEDGYYTKTEVETHITASKEEIELGVSKVYETKTSVTEKIKSVNDLTDEKLTLYSTTEEMNAAIKVQAEAIDLSVSKTYETKTTVTEKIKSANELAQSAADTAEENANDETDKKLKEYSTTEEMNAAIKLQADSITTEVNKKVNNSEFGTKITQNAYNVRVAWNNNSKYIQLEYGQLAIYNGDVTAAEKRAVFDERGNHFYRDGYYVGKIGTNEWSGNNAHKGLVFDLDYQGKYMAFAQMKSQGAGSYTTMLCFSRAGSIYDQYGIHLGCDFYGHWFDMYNVDLHDVNINGYGVADGKRNSRQRKRNSRLDDIINQCQRWNDYSSTTREREYIMSKEIIIEEDTKTETKEMILDLPEGERGITEEETETKEQQIKNTMLAQMDSKLDLILAYQEAALE